MTRKSVLSWTCMLSAIARVLLWKNLKEFVVYAATTYCWQSTTAVGEVLSCAREVHSAHNCYAVAVKMTGTANIVDNC